MVSHSTIAPDRGFVVWFGHGSRSTIMSESAWQSYGGPNRLGGPSSRNNINDRRQIYRSLESNLKIKAASESHSRRARPRAESLVSDIRLERCADVCLFCGRRGRGLTHKPFFSFLIRSRHNKIFMSITARAEGQDTPAQHVTEQVCERRFNKPCSESPTKHPSQVDDSLRGAYAAGTPKIPMSAKVPIRLSQLFKKLSN